MGNDNHYLWKSAFPVVMSKKPLFEEIIPLDLNVDMKSDSAWKLMTQYIHFVSTLIFNSHENVLSDRMS